MKITREDTYIYIRGEQECWVRPIEAWDNLRDVRQWIQSITADGVDAADIIAFVSSLALTISTRAAEHLAEQQADPLRTTDLTDMSVVIDSAAGTPVQR